MGMDGEELFAYAMEQYEDRDWDEAIDAFERLVASFPGHARSAEARIHLARAHFQKEEYITSAAEFERFLQRYPSHGLAPEASLGICRSYARLAPHPQRDQEYTRRAREACRATASEFQGMNVAQEADSLRVEMVQRLAERSYQEGRFYQRRNFHDSAILIFQDVVDFYPETEWAPQALLALFRSYEAIGWEEEARQARERLLFLYPDSEAAQEVAEARVNGDGDVR
jgi:outer membrane protein assembly factor BamD